MTNLTTAKLREMAEEKEIKGWEDMTRKELVEALKPKEESKEEVELSKLTAKELKKVAKEKGVDVKGLKKKADLIEAIEGGGGEEKEEGGKGEEPRDLPTLGAGIKAEHIPKGSRAEKMLIHLAKQPKVKILIPLEGKEKLGITTSVILNGLRLNIMKGVYVNVPEQIGEIIMQSQKQTVSALNNPLNLDNPEHPKKQSGEGLEEIDA